MNCSVVPKLHRLVSGTGDHIQGGDLELGKKGRRQESILTRHEHALGPMSRIGGYAGALDPKGNLRGVLKLTRVTL